MAADFKKKEPKILPGSDAKTEKLINYIMRNGKKNLARRIFADILVEIRNNGHMNPNAVIEAAIENASPHIMVRSKRIGGAVYQVPLEVKANKKVYFALKWILDAAKSKSGKPVSKRIADEFLAAYSNQGAAVKRKEEVHKMADANKAFAYMAKYVK